MVIKVKLALYIGRNKADLALLNLLMASEPTEIDIIYR